MKIRQIKAFLAVVQTGSVRRAAATLCVTQSTVAKAVKELENELGTPLFVRSTKGLRLNAAGESLRPYAETIASNADNAVDAVNAVVTGRHERLSLSVTPTLPPVILAAAMAHFRTRFPRVKVFFRSGFLSDCLPHLLTDKLELSLVMSGRHQHRALASLAEEPLMEVDQGIVAAPDHPVFAPDADLRAVFSQSEWLSTAQDEAFLLAKLKDFGVSPRALTLCDFFGIDALKGRNGALSLSPPPQHFVFSPQGRGTVPGGGLHAVCDPYGLRRAIPSAEVAVCASEKVNVVREGFLPYLRGTAKRSDASKTGAAAP